MTKTKKTTVTKRDTPDIRLRGLDVEFYAKIDELGKLLKQPTATKTIERVVTRYLQMQRELQDVQKRNATLHKAIAHYYDKEDKMLQSITRHQGAIKNYRSQLDYEEKQIKALQKLFGRKVKQPARKGRNGQLEIF